MPTLYEQFINQALPDGIITFEQYLQIPPNDRIDVIILLQDPEMQQEMANGQITIEGILALLPAARAAQAAAVAAAIAEPIFNGAQSIHVASVDQTISQSAIRLLNRYQSQIEDVGLEAIIENIRTYLDSLHNNSQKNTAAKRAFSRITACDYTFTDPRSNVTTRQLLALVFLAIHDTDKRTGNLEDAKNKFVEALYEIQRGYNLSANGTDNGKEDKIICTTGTFNKLIEKLQGIHSDCDIRYITSLSASYKLPIVVREAAMVHLAISDNPNKTKEQFRFTPLMAQVKEHGLETTIWNDIKQQVISLMFEEFGGGSLYPEIDNLDFQALIDAGKDVDLGSLLSAFQKIDLQLAKLENKAENLRDRTHILAFNKIENIVNFLRKESYKYFVEKKIAYMDYKANSLNIIKEERSELDKHRGYKQILGNLPLLIFTLGTAQLVKKTCTGGNFLFFTTDSSTYVDQLADTLKEVEFNSLSNRLS